METKKYNIIIIAIAAILFIGSIGYWIGNRNSDSELRNTAKKLQADLDTAVQRESAAIKSSDDIKSKLEQSNKYIEQLQNQNRQLTDTVNSIKSDSSKLIVTEQSIDSGLNEAIARLKRQQASINDYNK